MKSLHYTNKHIESITGGFNATMGILLVVAVFGTLILHGKPDKRESRKKEPIISYEREITELEYMVAVSEAKRKTPKLTHAEVAAMGDAAIVATPERCRKRLKCDAFVSAGF